MNTKKPKIIICGALQNCEKSLPKVFQNLENISSLAEDVGYIFVENDSMDNTKFLLKNFGRNKHNFNLINLDGLNAIPVRTIKLENIHNIYLETIRHNNVLKDFDYLVIIDMDKSGEYLINIQEISNAIEFLSSSPTRAAVFANQIGTYYDMWALRHPLKCPSDVWEEVLDCVIKYKYSDAHAFAETFEKKLFSIERSEDPIKVDSAFGGLGIYKMKFVLENPNPYLGYKIKTLYQEDGTLRYAKWQICEHVHFHAGIKSLGGEMFIYPSLINGDSHSSGLNFTASAFRGLLF